MLYTEGHYKSWSDLNKQLNSFLCEELKGRITYFLTRYHDVHNAYGRAAIRLDGKELVCFSWIEMYRQEGDTDELWYEDKSRAYEDLAKELKPKWDADCTYCESDFLKAVLEFRNMSVQDGLASENYIIKILAIMDRRVGKRTLDLIKKGGAYQEYPDWVKQFYCLRPDI